MELVAILLALAAFLVSYASLHLSTLRQADLELEYVADEDRAIREAGFTGPLPTGVSRVLVCCYPGRVAALVA